MRRRRRVPKRAAQVVGMLVLSTGAYGCRLILGIGDANERSPEAGAGDAGPVGDVDGDRSEGGSEAGAGKPCATTWCWENPLPQGQTLNAVWASSPTDIWAVGNGATVHFDGTTFEVKPTQQVENSFGFSKVTASGATVFALSAQPTFQIFRLDGDASTWRPTFTPSAFTGPSPMADLWSFAPDDAWAVGMSSAPPPGPLVVRLKPGGGSWQEEPFDAGAFQLFAVRGTASNDVWAIGPQTMSHWTGTAWSTSSCAATLGVSETECGNGPSFLVGAGPGVTSALQLVTSSGGPNGAKFYRWSGGPSGVWSSQPASPSLTAPIRAVAATSNGDVWLMEENVGTSFVRLRGGTLGANAALPERYSAMAAYGASEVIAVGENGAIGRTDGETWTAWPGTGGVRTTIVDLAVSNGEAIGVGPSGANAVAVRRRATTFFEESTITSVPGNAQSCWSGGANEQWYVARDIYRWSGAGFVQSYPAPADVMLRQIRGTGPTDIWAVGDDFSDGGQRGFAVHFDGTKWSVDSPAGSTQLSAVWIDPSTKDPWAVGPSGAVFRRVSGAWSRVDPSLVTTNPLVAITGTSSTDVWVAGPQIVAHWDGNSWSTLLPGGGSGGSLGSWSSLAAHAPNDVWAVAPDRGAAHWDGKKWTPVPGAPQQLSAVTFDSDGTPWVAGAGGAILRYGK